MTRTTPTDSLNPDVFMLYMTRILVTEIVMTKVSVAEAKASLSALVNRAEAGETVEILRHGKPAARLVPINALEPIDFDWLDTVTSTFPRTEADGVTRLRDEDRY